jgi:hypothetical protein
VPIPDRRDKEARATLDDFKQKFPTHTLPRITEISSLITTPSGRLEDALRNRLERFGLMLEPTKTKLVEFGRFAQRHAGKHGRKRPETIYFLGLTLYCTRNRKGNFKVGMRTEKSRLRRSLMSLQPHRMTPRSK